MAGLGWLVSGGLSGVWIEFGRGENMFADGVCWPGCYFELKEG